MEGSAGYLMRFGIRLVWRGYLGDSFCSVAGVVANGIGRSIVRHGWDG